MIRPTYLNVAAVVLFSLVCHPLNAQQTELTAETKAGLKLFQENVRTDLIHHCIECHGGKSIKGDFDLSTRDKFEESGHADKPASENYMMALIRHDEEPEMPFKKPKLPKDVIERIGKWIDLGAPYDRPLSETIVESGKPMVVTDDDRKFWSFQPLDRIELPNVKNQQWTQNEVDRFILARLESKSIQPNNPATKRTLIRRAYFDLIGLPPTPEQVDKFVNSSDPNAYENLIDELLASKHYGERWARHWMDIARFAESHGYEQDYDRPNAYHYRDFLIKAFNSDLPYDDFVRWQIAGDELAPNNPLAKMATGFLGAGVFPTQLTEAEFESARYDELDDMTATTGVAFLGLSVGCARCHDHKFDPIPTRDYYRMAATFTKTIRSEVLLDLEPAKNVERKLAFEATAKKLRKSLADYEDNELAKSFVAWIKSDAMLDSKDPWTFVSPSKVDAKGKYKLQSDLSLLATARPNMDEINFKGLVGKSKIAAIRLETLTDKSLPGNGPGIAPNGNFALGNIKANFIPNAKGKQDPKTVALKLIRATATHEQNKTSLSVAASLDQDPISGWAVDAGGIGKSQAAVFHLESVFEPTGEGTLEVILTFNHPNRKHAAGRFRISLTDQPDLPAAVGKSGIDTATKNSIVSLRKSSAEDTRLRDSKDFQTAMKWFRTKDKKWNRLNEQLASHLAKGPKVQLTKVQINSENVPKMSHHADGRGYPHFYPQTHLLDRGDVSQKKEVVQAGFLQILNPANSDEKKWFVSKPDSATTEFSRASLVNWMTDTKNGSGQLLARVIVNRIWQHHFGRGIVATPNDFGFQGERPTHPKLLDWLANNLIDNDWKLKRLHKLMMMSSVYRQSTRFDAARSKIDPDNLLLWRRTPRRLESEAIRDSLLAVSGQLDTTQFGRGSLDPNMKRRSIYFFIKRSKLIPQMMLFDWPEHLVSIGKRSSTTIAPQALMFMNSRLGRQSAESLAKNSSGKSDLVAIDLIYQKLFGRSPSKAEQELAGSFLDSQAKFHLESKTKNPEHVAMIDLCQALLSSNEFIFID